MQNLKEFCAKLRMVNLDDKLFLLNYLENSIDPFDVFYLHNKIYTRVQ